jgi:XTP/dITP diphosphohydrolase
MRLVLATRNPHKVRELTRLLGTAGVEFYSCREFPDVPEVEEDGATLEENAAKKALVVARATGLPTLADDTGLEVDALGGAPGVLSARYAGEDATYEDNNRKLLKALAGVTTGDRGASFRCVVALATPEGDVHLVEGRTRGRILEAPRGSGGFGYDPLFEPLGSGRTYAEMSPAEKNEVSHRGRAVRAAGAALAELVRERSGPESRPDDRMHN